MANPFRKISNYCSDVVEELKKCSWPNKKELVESTIVVIIGCLILAFYVAAFDKVFSTIVRWIIG